MSGLGDDHEHRAGSSASTMATKVMKDCPRRRRAHVASARHAAGAGSVSRPRPGRPSPSGGRRPRASAVRPSTTATSRPRYMTPIRSESSRTSSSSAETRSTAVPASRLAIIWRWMNSMLPTSRPRVGWSRTSEPQVAARTRGRRRPSAGCRPTASPAATSADGVRMSNSLDGLDGPRVDRSVVTHEAAAEGGCVVVGEDEVVRQREATAPGRTGDGRPARRTRRARGDRAGLRR